MIKVNLLGKKKLGGLPPQLQAALDKAGITPEELYELRPGLIKVAVIAAGIYLGGIVPATLHQTKLDELATTLDDVSKKEEELRGSLKQKQAIRQQMNQLNNDERDMRSQLDAVNALQRDRGLSFRTVDLFTKILPERVWISEIKLSDRNVNLQVSAWTLPAANEFIRAITESTQFTDVRFNSITTTPPSAPVEGVRESVQAVKTFELSFKVKGTE
jgi:Tfp pilus assembly protein PilN